MALPSFSDQADDVGLIFTHVMDVDPPQMVEPQMMTHGAAAADFNRDGWLDVFVVGGSAQASKLFMNDGTGSFTDEASAWGINDAALEGSSVTVADIDGNGYLDIYVGVLFGRNQCLMNTGNGWFVETGLSCGAVLYEGQPFNTFGAAFGDIDGDGDLDLLTSEWGLAPIFGNRIFRNLGNGIFTDATNSVGIFLEPDAHWGFTPSLVDLNGDLAPDIAISGDFGSSRYYQNVGLGHFARVTSNGTCTDENGMGSALGDYDNDGDLDWFVTAIHDNDGVSETGWGITGNRLYRNDGNDQFTDVTDKAGVRAGFWGWGTGFADFNHDGLLDLTMTNGMQYPFGGNPDPTFAQDPTRLWLNTGNFADNGPGKTYMEVSFGTGLVDRENGKGLVVFDSDNDGDLDILITNNRGPVRYFENESNPLADRWIEIDLVAPAGTPPDGIGAWIEVEIGDHTYHRAVRVSSSFMSQHPLRQHFGFPPTNRIDKITVTWQNGSVVSLENVPPGQILTIGN
ncbi:MAG: CRTAC1 family protein [Planctomycetes bacterium]|nr:CRTAC1 family protein [Planctomycetota bacterium]